MLRRKKKEQVPDEWVLQVFEDTFIDRKWDQDEVRVMLGKVAWGWIIYGPNGFERIPPPDEGFPTWEEAVTAGIAAINGERNA